MASYVVDVAPSVTHCMDMANTNRRLVVDLCVSEQCRHKYDRYENGVRVCLKCDHQISVNPEDRDE